MGRAGGGGFSGGGRGGSFGGSRGGSFGGGGSSGRAGGSGFGSYNSGVRPGTGNGYGHNGYGSFWGVPRVSGPVIIANNGNRKYTTPVNNGNNSGNNNQNNNTPNNNSTKGCIHIALIAIMVFSLIILLFTTASIIGNDQTERTKLNANITETSYFTDELGWIDNSSVLIDGMKYFYKETGVQPHLYITDNVGGSFYDYAEEFANNKYDQLFNDEAHLLVIFYENGGMYNTYCLSGSVADSVMDYDARMILLNALDEYYYDSSLDDNEYFSKSFRKAADKIMAKPSSNAGAIVIPLIVFVAALGAEIVIAKKAKDEKKEKELKEMLEKPLETFGNTQAEELAKKYESTSDNSGNRCKKCNSVVEVDSNFCSSCGEKL